MVHQKELKKDWAQNLAENLGPHSEKGHCWVVHSELLTKKGQNLGNHLAMPKDLDWR